MTPLLVGLSILVVASFAAGSLANVRRGSAALRWMQGGLPRLGARTRVRWLGTTAIELFLRQPVPPLKEVAVIVFLEPRDLPWAWAFARARRAGRRDTLIVRALLRDPPRLELEAIDPESWSGREALRRLPPSAGWTAYPAPAALALRVLVREPKALARAEALLPLAARTGAPIFRLSVRSAPPHLQLHLALPGPTLPAGAFFEAIGVLAEALSH
ncbi:MAG TPA: hypothetical protein VFG53_07660 [Anaeromyxobacter sp.]|nr:hypothetical protein [Anaeromyxobacter sp.]